jgi:hypothetical protein
MPAYLFVNPELYADLIATDTDPEAAPFLHAAAERLRDLRDEYRCSRIELSELTNIDLELLTIVELGIGNLETSQSVIDRVEERLEQIQKARASRSGSKIKSKTKPPRDT